MIDFLCIGAQKAGTTWLMANLARHPEIWTPPFIKEVHYFDAAHGLYGKPRALKSYQRRGTRLIERRPELEPYFGKVVDPDFAFTDDWYAHIFSLGAKKKKKKKGECTPLYCALPDDGVAHVKRLAPKVRLVFMIRDPFSRMMSSFRMAMENRGVTDGSAIGHLLEDELFQARGDYRANIPRWENQFDKSQILYVPFGLVKTDPERVLRDVEKHLGLAKYDGYPRLGESIHPTNKENKIIGDDLVSRMRELAAPQDAFLVERFGPELAAATK